MFSLPLKLATLLAVLAEFVPVVTLAADGRQQRQLTPWPKFEIIMWQAETSAQYETLAKLGITGARVPSDHDSETTATAAAKVAPLAQMNLNSYVENIATDFYSSYHRWFPDRPVNSRFLEAKQQLAANPASEQPFVRVPSLSNKAWLGVISRRLRTAVRAYAPYHPLFFNLADESGIADLTAFWDFDFSDLSIEAFKSWLKGRYFSLSALNREWGTKYARWEDVRPQTTTDAMQQPNGNYSRWSDFKDWMDLAFTRAIATGTAAVHAGRRWARAGVEGVQIPGWGGYNYSLLAGSVDVMEMSADDVALHIMRSLDPHLVMLTTSFGSGPTEEHLLWQHLLLGARGLILWDENNEVVRENGTLGARGQFFEPQFAALRGRVGAAILDAVPLYSPVAILYSPASFRVQWMLDHRAAGSAWTARQADTEDEDDPYRTATREALYDTEALGFTPRFVTAEQIDADVLRDASYRLLILPQALALSPQTTSRIRYFAKLGGRVAILGDAGLFDEHGRQLEHSDLDDLFPKEQKRTIRVALSDHRAIQSALARLAAAAKLVPRFQIFSEGSRQSSSPLVRSYMLHRGSTAILALQRDLEGSGDDGGSRDVTVELQHPTYVYDVRDDKKLGHLSRLQLSVSAGIPTVVELSDRLPLPISRPSRDRTGR
jgi:hypothetical protein